MCYLCAIVYFLLISEYKEIMAGMQTPEENQSRSGFLSEIAHNMMHDPGISGAL